MAKRSLSAAHKKAISVGLKKYHASKGKGRRSYSTAQKNARNKVRKKNSARWASMDHNQRRQSLKTNKRYRK